MSNYLFTSEQGNLLVRLVIAHLLSDFVFQTNKMVDNKSWASKYMWGHTVIVYVSTAVLTGWWELSFVVALSHYLIDTVKIEVQNRSHPSFLLFAIDQLAHLMVLIAVWTLHFHSWPSLQKALLLPFNDYKISLLLLGYLLITTPSGYLIKFAIQNIAISNDATNSKENAGR